MTSLPSTDPPVRPAPPRVRALGPRVRHGARKSHAPLEVRWRGTVPYADAFDEQHRLAAERADGSLDHDVLLLLEHPAVFTAGKRTSPEDRPVDGTPVVDVDRGGKITWHGPGQLVGYPIVALAEPLDVVDYVRRIEAAMISVCADWHVDAQRVMGRSGAWVPGSPAGVSDRKIAAIGIRVARGVALHGFALNCDPDLSAFGSIIPCGIPDAGVTSLTTELGRTVRVEDVRDAVAAAVQDALDTDTDPVQERSAAPAGPPDATVAGVRSSR